MAKSKAEKVNKVSKIKFGVVNYPVGDFLIQVKNAAMAGNKEVSFVKNKSIEAVANTMKKLGYFDFVKVDEQKITVALSFKSKKPILMDLKLISKPGLRIYMDVSMLEKKKGPSVYLVSTPKGVLSSREAIKTRVGGEVIAEIY